MAVNMNKPLGKSAGIALVTVLLVVAVATIAAVSISARLQVDIRRTENLLRADQAWLHMLSVEAWAKAELKEDAKNSDKVDHLGERWNTLPMTDSSVEGGEVKGSIIDQQGLFNINNLIDQLTKKADPLNKHRFERLLIDRGLNPGLVNGVIDWLDEDSHTQGLGDTEDGYYQSLSSPYSTANRPMVHRSELLLVKGFTLEDYKELAPFVTALPVLPGVATEVNINTASRVVLESILIGIANQTISSMTTVEIDALIDIRKTIPFPNNAAINNYLPAAVSRTGLGVESSYFRVQSDVTVGRARLGVTSLVHREPLPSVDVKVLQRMREDIKWPTKP